MALLTSLPLIYYTACKIKHQENPHSKPSVSGDQEAEETMEPSWPVSTGSVWLVVVLWVLHRLLKYVNVWCRTCDPLDIVGYSLPKQGVCVVQSGQFSYGKTPKCCSNE